MYGSGDDLKHLSSVNLTPTQLPTNEGKSSVLSIAVNMTNNIIGAGLLSMPWVLKEATIVTGLASLCVIGFVNAYSFLLLARCCDYAGSFSYKEMAVEAFGRSSGIIIQFCMLAYTFGSCISYVVLTADFLIGKNTGVFVEWAGGSILTNRAFMLTLLAIFVLLPLCSLKTLHCLRFTSFVSVLCTVYTVYLMIYKFVQNGVADDIDTFGFPLGVWQACPIVNVAFTAHYNGPRYYQELSDRSISRFTLAVAIAVVLSTTFYSIIALCGYLTYGGDVMGDVINNMGRGDGQAITARLAMASTVVFTYPFAFHSLRTTIFSLLESEESLEEVEGMRSRRVTQQLGLGVSSGSSMVDGGSEGEGGGRNDSGLCSVGSGELLGADALVGGRGGGGVTLMLDRDPGSQPLLWSRESGLPEELGGGGGGGQRQHEGEKEGGGCSYGWWHGLTPSEQFWFVTLTVLVLTVGLGIVLVQVEVVLDYKGAIFGSSIVYIFPSLMYVRLRQRHAVNRAFLLNGSLGSRHPSAEFSDNGSGFMPVIRSSSVSDIPQLALMTWGIALAIMGTVITALTQAHVLNK